MCCVVLGLRFHRKPVTTEGAHRFEVASNGTITHHVNAYPLPLRVRRVRKHSVRTYLQGAVVVIGAFLALAYIAGSHVQADAQQVVQTTQSCTAKADDIDTLTFNPCATLDTTQVQDRRVGAPTCVWDRDTQAWVQVPCHYSSPTLDITITRQPGA